MWLVLLFDVAFSLSLSLSLSLCFIFYIHTQEALHLLFLRVSLLHVFWAVSALWSRVALSIAYTFIIPVAYIARPLNMPHHFHCMKFLINTDTRVTRIARDVTTSAKSDTFFFTQANSTRQKYTRSRRTVRVIRANFDEESKYFIRKMPARRY